jgi:Putative peptidoglycan binding domain
MVQRRRRCEVFLQFACGCFALVFSVVWGTDLKAVARTSVARQQIGVEQRLGAEKRPWELGYWAGPVDGTFDSASRHALVAFQKVEGRTRTGNLTWTELKALQSATRPRAHYEGFAQIEIDLSRQELFIIDESGTVSRIPPVSSGNEKLYVDRGQVHRAHTPRGTFKEPRYR